jgi:tetratricopeptide (TPR) repeat protein
MATPYQMGEIVGLVSGVLMVLVTLRVFLRGIRLAVARVIGERPVKVMTNFLCGVLATAAVIWLGACARGFLRGAATAVAHQELEQAAVLGKSGDFASAVRLSTEVIDRQPTNVTAYLVRGTAHRRAGDLALAIADLDRAIELDPQNSMAYTQRASARQLRQRRAYSEEILADLNRAIELDPSSALAHVLRGHALLDLDEQVTAIADYDRAASLDPQSYLALGGRASAKISLGQIDEARRDLQKALELDPPPEERSQLEELLHIANSQGD